MGTYEELRLSKLLLEFHQGLYSDYKAKTEKLITALSATPQYGLYECIPQDADPDKIVAVRVLINYPLFALLSHPLCRMHIKQKYPIEYEWERFYVAQLGILPVYLPSFNTVSVVKFWGEGANQVTKEALEVILGRKESLCMLKPTDRKMIFSTMNFVLPFGAGLYVAPQELQDIMRRYLVYTYWLPTPSKGFSFSSHFLHDRHSVSHFLKLTKTLFALESVGDSHVIHVHNRPLNTRNVRLRMLTNGRNGFSFARVNSHMPVDMLEELGQSPREVFLNAIEMEIKMKDNQPEELVSVLSDEGMSFYELAQTMLGFLVSSEYYSSSNIAFLGRKDELFSKAKEQSSIIFSKLQLRRSVSETFDNIMEIAFSFLRPMIFEENNLLYFVHPLLIEYLYSLGRLNLIMDKKKWGNLVILLGFMEKINTGKKHMDLFLDSTLDEIKKDILPSDTKSNTLKQLTLLVNRIRISKLIRQVFDTNFPQSNL